MIYIYIYPPVYLGIKPAALHTDWFTRLNSAGKENLRFSTLKNSGCTNEPRILRLQSAVEVGGSWSSLTDFHVGFGSYGNVILMSYCHTSPTKETRVTHSNQAKTK